LSFNARLEWEEKMINRKVRALIISLVTMMAVISSSVACTQSSPSSVPAPTTSAAPANTVAPATSSGSASAGAPIKVGVLNSLTGTDAINSPGIKAALEYRLDQYGGQVAGRKVQIIMEDDATDPVTGMDKVKKLMQSDNVDVVMGGANGGVAGAAANFLKQSETPLILFMPKSPSLLTLNAKNVIIPYGLSVGNGYRSGLYATQKLGYKTTAILYEDFIGGQENYEGAKAGFETGGGKVVQNMPVKPGTADFGPYLSTLNKVDCIIFWFTPLLTQRFVAQYNATGLKMPLILTNCSVFGTKALEDSGDKAAGMIGIDMYTPLIDTPINKTYVENFTKKYGLAALTTISLSADVCLTLYLEAVKTTGGNTSLAKINEALHSIKIETPSGTLSITPNGLGKGDLYILKASKLDNGSYAWTVMDKLSQVVFEVPK
jgi:branched-chain amino acid transport system substrate-binding protein